MDQVHFHMHIHPCPSSRARDANHKNSREYARCIRHHRGLALRLGALTASPCLLPSPCNLLTPDIPFPPLLPLLSPPIFLSPALPQGTSSLVRRTLYSFTDTADRIVSSVSSGILASGAVDVSVRGGTGVVRPYGALDGVCVLFFFLLSKAQLTRFLFCDRLFFLWLFFL